MPIDDPSIQKALGFIDSVRTDDSRTAYFEVAETDHSEHKVYPQTQYLTFITFDQLGISDKAQILARTNDFTKPDTIDTTRNSLPANARYCVLLGDTDSFYMAGQEDSDYNDVMALLAIYWLKKPGIDKTTFLWKKMLERYDLRTGILEMDPAELQTSPTKPAPLHAVYKLALFGILAQMMGDSAVLQNVQQTLHTWQSEPSGGWITDRTVDMKPNGVANLETTCLSILALRV